MMDHQIVAPVRVDGGPGGQGDALPEYRGPEIKVLDKLLDVDSKLAQLGGHGGTRHAHLGGDVSPQAAYVMLDLGGGCLLEPCCLGGHGRDNKDPRLSTCICIFVSVSVCQCLVLGSSRVTML